MPHHSRSRQGTPPRSSLHNLGHMPASAAICAIGASLIIPTPWRPRVSVWEIAGLMALAYLLLLARSAWRQGEFRQFLWSLLIIAGIIGAIAAVVLVSMTFGMG